MITMTNVYKTYPNGAKAVNGISVTIKQGEFVYVVGPSGAGKSTFIKMMYREQKPTSGSIRVNGMQLETMQERDIPYFRRRIGVIFQDFKLLPKLTVYENVAFALEVIGEEKSAIRQKVAEVLKLVRLSHKTDALPNQLSGGEQQRVAIARAIVNKPQVVIADEPTGNLDINTSWEIMEIFKEINKQGTTIIMATHNADIVNTFRNRVLAIEGGKIVRDEIEGGYGYDS
ncbi:cell division ATP-binding protein FtsE [Ectobacillus ponti]|uniref:Cell division ATP-binding protein FtsE n=1 Tax=Ectobacillus ponti TaxID=2961894 RepID=A0AA42BNQ0_9BACI|nr:cell division ATP-binding protein FtsE [Ectobacillus ponti]MCP8967616.1 cell division ATP-binding protein FtsE [Ectobacillus ponti]